MSVKIITPEVGRHNVDLNASRDRIMRGQTYRNCSTVCIIPTRGLLFPRVVQSWFGLMTPMNHPFLRWFVTGHEVGVAYQQAVEFIVHNPELSKWPYVLTMEEDNMPPPDGLLKLIEAIEGGVDGKKYDAVSGLYWTKGEAGQPMIYGDPQEMPLSFRPQAPVPNTVQRCNGLGMGFTLFRIKMFTSGRVPLPWFQTHQSYAPGIGGQAYTQDLFFFERAGKVGYKFAVDTRVKVGHYDPQTDTVW